MQIGRMASSQVEKTLVVSECDSTVTAGALDPSGNGIDAQGGHVFFYPSLGQDIRFLVLRARILACRPVFAMSGLDH